MTEPLTLAAGLARLVVLIVVLTAIVAFVTLAPTWRRK